MDTKNTIAAISLSAAVIIIWSLFFGPSPEEIKQNKINQEQVKQEQNQKNSDTPSLDQNENFSKLSREEALNENKRIRFENKNFFCPSPLDGFLEYFYGNWKTPIKTTDKSVYLSKKNYKKNYWKLYVYLEKILFKLGLNR